MTKRPISTGIDIDWMTLSLYLGLVLTGWLMIFAVGYQGEETKILDFTTRHGSQMMWIGISLSIGLVIMLVDTKFYQTFSYIIYIFFVVALLYVLIAGTIVAGSKSWIDLGFFRFQPSEFAKFATCLALASFLGSYNTNLQHSRTRFIALGILGIPLMLTLLQGDAGSALVFTSLLIVLYREGMPLPIYIFGGVIAVLSVLALWSKSYYPILIGLSLVLSGILVNSYASQRGKVFYLMIGGVFVFAYNKYPDYQFIIMVCSIGLLFLIFLIKLIKANTPKQRSLAYIILMTGVLSSIYVFSVNYVFNEVFKPHQRDRILVWLRPAEADPLGARYNVTWSQRAIGSGGLTGKGFLEGHVTKLKYVPEQATDFIFCTIGEEQGFIGSLAVILLFLLLLLRIIFLAERQRSKFTRVYAYGVASIIFFHLLVNIGMTMGLVPVIGIPLPFISYGGSSLIAFTILLFILLKLDGDRVMVFR